MLFADLVGSTTIGERLDPEDVRTLQGDLFALLNAEVERFGGVSEKFAGDAVMAVFGIPQMHEDDAERAVRAALAVQAAFPAFATEARDRHGARPHCASASTRARWSRDRTLRPEASSW